MSPRDELAQAFVDEPGWRWLAGMANQHGDRVLWHDAVGVSWCGPANSGWLAFELCCDFTPNLADPATLGCIEHGLLPKLWGQPLSRIVFSSGIVAFTTVEREVARGTTLQHALLGALRFAPEEAS